jgi:type I restriction enzyme R subunit
LYSGDKPLALFADRLEANLNRINRIFADIESLFASAGIADFAKLPDDMAACAMFAQWFGQLCDRIEAAKIQGFDWDKQTYEFKNEQGKKTKVILAFDCQTFLVLLQRYKELLGGGGGAGGGGDVPFDIRGYLTEISTGKIDAEYMNSSFDKYIKLLKQGDASDAEREQTLNELHKTFAALSQEEQAVANSFLFKVQSGDITLQSGKTLRDYITELQAQAKSDQISRFASTFGIREADLRRFIESGVTESNIGEHGRFKELIDQIDKTKAKAYFEKLLGKTISTLESNREMRALLRQFILAGGMDIE